MMMMIIRFISGPKIARGVHGSQILKSQAFFKAKILMTDHDLPRAFCLVKVNKMLLSAESQTGVRPLACISSCVKGKRLDGVSFGVLEGEECIFESVCI